MAQGGDSRLVRFRCRCAAKPARAAMPAAAPGPYCYLFDVDEELAGDLDLRMRLVARPMATAGWRRSRPASST